MKFLKKGKIKLVLMPWSVLEAEETVYLLREKRFQEVCSI